MEETYFYTGKAIALFVQMGGNQMEPICSFSSYSSIFSWELNVAFLLNTAAIEFKKQLSTYCTCLLYTSDAADE